MKYFLTKYSLRLLQFIPFGVYHTLHPVLTFTLKNIVRYRRNVVRNNLRESFPNKSEAELKGIENGFYNSFVDNFIETVKMGRMSDNEISRRMKFLNIAEINEELKAGNSIGLYLGHFANWEWISSMPLHLYPGAVTAQIYHKLSNPVADRLMLEERASHGAINVEMRQTARFINHQVREGRVSIVGFIADQSPRYRQIDHYLPFLNHITPVMSGTEKIIRRYGFQPWFVAPRRVGRGKYEVTFIKMTEDAASLPEQALTEIYYRMLEKEINNAPELYLWSHKRFKFAKGLIKQPNSKPDDGN